MMMMTSPQGRAFIARWEGLRTDAYQDSVGVWTIGVGHTSRAGPPTVQPGMHITREQALSILAADLARFERWVLGAVHVTVASYEFDALVSLCFNIGPANFANSSVARRLNQGDRRGAADAFLMWTRAGGRVLQGLVKVKA